VQIQGAVALVTGANRGIGKSFVQALLDRGAAKVYAGARNPAAVDVTDDRVRSVRLDVTDPSSIAALGEELPDVRLVVNNAGIARPGSPLSVTSRSKA
jgi:NAD(P)-dependent dehydrogenase (short-subunit alcohol dehydrogenase family)